MTIEQYFKENSKDAIAFSGGVDSAFLLCEALKAGADVKAYYVKSAFQPAFELEDALRTADALSAEMKVIEVDILADPIIASNPEDRCYYCKQRIMSAIIKAANEDGYEIVCDGTNASDDVDDRPGFRVLGEFGIRSPLKECGITKAQIREGAGETGLSVWNKPAYACLATRIKTGEVITADKLRRTEEAESILRGMWYRDFRVRMRGSDALVQIKEDQHEDALKNEQKIINALAHLYKTVTIDIHPRY